VFTAPGQDYALPIEAVGTNRIRIQPDRKPNHKPLMLLDAKHLADVFRGLWLQVVKRDPLRRFATAEDIYPQMSTF